MLKVWNLVLVVASFTLAIFGTFEVRSGIISSVHSFAYSDIGIYFPGISRHHHCIQYPALPVSFAETAA